MTTVTATHPTSPTEIRRLPRTTGALTGFLVILLGLWGALVPFFGPYFHYAFGSYQTWHYTTERLWLNIVPGAVAVIGGLMLLRSAHRTSGLIGGWLAVAAGAWFAIGLPVSLLWHHAGNPIGAPMGGHTRQAIELLGYFYGLGVLIAALSAFAMGRYFSRPRVVVEAAAVAEDAALAEEAAVAHHERAAAEGPVARDERVGAEAPVAGAAAGAVAAREEPVAARDEPLAARDEPLAGRDEPLARREPVSPLAGREASVADREEPLAGEREPLADREEPLAAREPETERVAPPTAEPASPAAAEPAAAEPASSANADAVAPAGTTPEADTITYRRRPGLSRLRRR
jgi:hypothetical protein